MKHCSTEKDMLRETPAAFSYRFSCAYAYSSGKYMYGVVSYLAFWKIQN